MDNSSKILVIEPNPHHFVVIPGFVYYIDQLGYKIDCLVRRHDLLGNEFCLCKRLQSKINFIYFNEDLIEKILLLQDENTYDYIFLTSFDFFVDGKICSIYKDIKEVDSSRFGVVGCYHALSSYLINKDNEQLPINRIISLSKIEDSISFTVVTPCFFSEIKQSHQKTDKTEIISVGVNNGANESRYNLNKLYLSYGDIPTIRYIGGKRGKELQKSQTKKKLLYPIIKLLNVKKYMNERYAPFPKIKKEVTKKIIVEGEVRFEEMYQYIQDADFILINTANRLSEEFCKNRTSGSKLLSLGFCKPCIIERKYADHYGFSDKNAVIYNQGDMESGLKRALTMDQMEYKEMCMQLSMLIDEIMKKSMDNFKNLLYMLQVER